MSSNRADLEGSLTAAGLQPAAAKIIANALANLESPKTLQATTLIDSTPTDAMRLITSDTRNYRLKNLDHVAQEPARRAKSSRRAKYVQQKTDHPYRDSQPVDTGQPLNPQKFTGEGAVQITSETENNVPLYKIGLRVRGEGQHMVLASDRQSIRGVRLSGGSTHPTRARLEVESGPDETEVFLRLIGLEQVTVSLPDGGTKNLLVWTT